MLNRGTLVGAAAAWLVGASAVGAWAVESSPWVEIGPQALPANAQAEQWVSPDVFLTVQVDITTLEADLATAPLEFSDDADVAPLILDVPHPDGGTTRFAAVETYVMAPELAARYPEIRTYVGNGLDDPTARLRADLTPAGFHGQVLSAAGSYYIDPLYRGDASALAVYWRHDNESMRPAFGCEMMDLDGAGAWWFDPQQNQENQAYMLTGEQLRTYRLACAATGEYTQFHGGTKSAGLAAIVTAINRVTGVYERDLAIRLELVPNNDDIVYTNGSTDPYSNNNGGAMLSQNISTCNSVIGSANYDIGHVFSTGGGGVAFLGVICTSSKAGGVTGLGAPIGDSFYIDYVAHEMGHQYGATHTFNGVNGSCSGNRTSSTAFEPGSGTTIMAYAGICGADDVANHSDDHFHAASIQQIISYAHNGTGDNCAAKTGTGNTDPVVDAGANRTIPAETPFELTASASDVDNDTLTYCWEEWDLGPAQALSGGDNGSSPLFRSWSPSSSPTRVFPRLSNLLNNTLPPGEKLPTTNRTMDFIVTVRDNNPAGGATDQDTLTLTVSNSAGPFLVTAPNTNVTWRGIQLVQWDVANTNSAPVSAATVDILLSTDNGQTFPIVLAAGTANDGSEAVGLPALSSSQARIKVKGSGNYFFDVSDAPFTLEPGELVIELPSGAPDEVMPGVTTVFPVTIIENTQSLDPNGARLLYRVDPNAAYTDVALTALGGTSYEATLPALDCAEGVEYYIEARGDGGATVRSPLTAPATTYVAIVGTLQPLFADDFETDQGWSVSGNASDGAWERGAPVEPGGCNPVQPQADHDGSGQAYLTGIDALVCNSDVDNGTTSLTSPVFDLSFGGAVSYALWLADTEDRPIDAADLYEVAYSTDGVTWIPVRTYTTPASDWRTDTIYVGQETPTSATMQFRFSVTDLGDATKLEAGLDAFHVDAIDCVQPETCPEDLDGNNQIDSTDLAILLGNFGATSGATPEQGDIDGDGDIDSTDLAMLLGVFGSTCP